MKKKKYPDLCAPGQSCIHKCKETCTCCKICTENKKKCETCPKNRAYDLLQTGMIGGPTIVFCRYANAGKTKIRPQIYDREAKTCKSLEIYRESNKLEYLIFGENQNPRSKLLISQLKDGVLSGEFFGFVHVDIKVPKNLKKKFSKYSHLCVVDEVS